jgi:SpoIID/LytB domain protein
MAARARLRSHRRPIAALLFLAVACTSDPDAGAEPTPRAPSGTTTPTTSPPAADGTGPRPSNSVRIEAPVHGSFLVRGSYPHVESGCKDAEQPRLTARYPGTLSAERAADGTLAVTVTLPFDRYLEGIAEVPPSWPREALEAQAIAARSYALATTGWDGAEGQTLDTPICATTACQVYRGIPVPRVPGIRRWYRAVQRTTGKVLLFRGRPAETVYFSTSNGHTYGNEDVFGSAPLPYLRPVVERHDGASPTSRWRVTLPFRHVTRFLRAAGEWPHDRAISGTRSDGSNLEVTGGTRSRTLDQSTFRDSVNAWAPCLMPSRYPPSPLPLTIPSRWLTISAKGSEVVVTGRGWGHGAGMVQWGAYGKARRGFSASQILASYYGGLRPRTYPEPGLIHVQVASGLRRLRIRPSAAGATMDGDELGTGILVIAGGKALTVDGTELGP